MAQSGVGRERVGKGVFNHRLGGLGRIHQKPGYQKAVRAGGSVLLAGT